jgi:hypothetical protein
MALPILEEVEEEVALLHTQEELVVLELSLFVIGLMLNNT